MIKPFLLSVLLFAILGFGKPQAVMFFSVENLELDEFVPKKNACSVVKAQKPIFYYIYSKKPFDTDYLRIIFIHLDNKGIIFSKPEITQTMNVDVTPGDYAVKSEVTLYKEGQILVRVFSPKNLDKPLIEAQITTEL